MDIKTMLTTWTASEMVDTLANAMATDYLRGLNVDELPAAMNYIQGIRPDVAEAIRRDYPHRCKQEGLDKY